MSSTLQRLHLGQEERELVGEFVDAYLNLNEHASLVFETLLKESGIEEQEGINQMVSSWKREGIEEGRVEGRVEGLHEGKLDIVFRQLVKRFGPCAAVEQKQIEMLDIPKLNALAEAIFDFSNSDDLSKWLEINTLADKPSAE